MLLGKTALKRCNAAAAVTWEGKRLLVFLALAIAQILVISYHFNFATDLPEWINPVAYAKRFVNLAVLAFVAFWIVAWPKRKQLLGDWTAASRAQHWQGAVLVNLLVFAGLFVATVGFSRHAASSVDPPWLLYSFYCALLLINAASLALIAAPVSYWIRFLRSASSEVAFATCCAVLVLLAAELSRESWRPLSAATLLFARSILSLYETNVVVDLAQQVLGTEQFRVLILTQCSGYEGIGLVTAFLVIYLWMFRAELRFPNALLILPLGIAAIWILNAVRIAALISIGTHFSPTVALNGFHSQAGWIAFLLVTVCIMAMAHRMRFFRSRPRVEGIQRGARDRLLLALLLPFMALMASNIVAQAFAPHDQWFHGIKVVAVLAVLWLYRDVYVGFVCKASPLAVFAGAAVGVAWILTDPNAGAESALGLWLASLPASVAAGWMAMRALSTIILVPIAEELAFRGYLHRALISRHFETVALGHFTWLAFAATSILFGLMHQRWLAGAIAGAVYAIVMYRTGRLSDPIASHMTSNGVIFVWAVAAHQWSLL